MLGHFRVTEAKDGLRLLIFGPRDLAEAGSGVPQAAFVLWTDDKMVFDGAKLAAFVNAALAASHGDNGPMEVLVGKPRPVVAA